MLFHFASSLEAATCTRCPRPLSRRLPGLVDKDTDSEAQRGASRFRIRGIKCLAGSDQIRRPNIKPIPTKFADQISSWFRPNSPTKSWTNSNQKSRPNICPGPTKFADQNLDQFRPNVGPFPTKFCDQIWNTFRQSARPNLESFRQKAPTKCADQKFPPKCRQT